MSTAEFSAVADALDTGRIETCTVVVAAGSDPLRRRAPR
jgi:hypothetical protein